MSACCAVEPLNPLKSRQAQVAIEFAFDSADNRRLANLVGPVDRTLRQIESALDVRITRRAASFAIEGAPVAARSARTALERLHRAADAPLTDDQVQLNLIDISSAGQPEENAQEPVLLTRRNNLVGRTPTQRDYVRRIIAHDITFGIGPAGTGKTFLAVGCAVDAIERDQVKRIVLTRPAVEAGERLGFLPGDLAQKVDPYLRPLYDALYDLLGAERVARMIERQVIEIAPLAYMRGRTLADAFVILDEAQNTTPEQMKMFLTRIGLGSKAVITGDVSQIDLPRGQRSGLVAATTILSDVQGIAFVRFSSADVVRHPLVARIVDAYERHETAGRADDDATGAAGAPAARAAKLDKAAPRKRSR